MKSDSEQSQKSEISLSPQQQKALDAVKEGKNVFISGSAGVGKSFLVKEIVNYFEEEGKRFSKTSSTGMASVAIGGQTIHSVGGIPLRIDPSDPTHSYANLAMAMFWPAKKNWTQMDALVIDEISMLDPLYLKTLDMTVRTLRCNMHRPFGGIQLVMVGDFLQLPPVHKKEDTEKKGFVEFAFELPQWAQYAEVSVLLETPFRQAEDTRYFDLLNRMRYGKLTESDIDLLRTRINAPLENIPAGIIPTHMYPYNSQVDSINNEHMRALGGSLETEQHIYKYSQGFETPKQKKAKIQTNIPAMDVSTANRRKKLLQKLIANAPVGDTVTLRVGAQVMLVANTDVKRRLVNGSRGVVVGFGEFEPYLPIVKFASGETCSVDYHTWRISDGKLGDVLFNQMPLKLAWAISIHKSQSATLEFALIDLPARRLAPGQAYVAFSRVSTLSGLTLSRFDPQCVWANQKVVSFYQHMKMGKKFPTISDTTVAVQSSSSSSSQINNNKRNNDSFKSKRFTPYPSTKKMTGDKNEKQQKKQPSAQKTSFQTQLKFTKKF